MLPLSPFSSIRRHTHILPCSFEHVYSDVVPRAPSTFTLRHALTPFLVYLPLHRPSLLPPGTWPQAVRRKANGQASGRENSRDVSYSRKSSRPADTHRLSQARSQKVRHSLGGHCRRAPRGSRPSVIHTRRHVGSGSLSVSGGQGSPPRAGVVVLTR